MGGLTASDVSNKQAKKSLSALGKLQIPRLLIFFSLEDSPPSSANSPCGEGPDQQPSSQGSLWRPHSAPHQPTSYKRVLTMSCDSWSRRQGHPRCGAGSGPAGHTDAVGGSSRNPGGHACDTHPGTRKSGPAGTAALALTPRSDTGTHCAGLTCVRASFLQLDSTAPLHIV